MCELERDGRDQWLGQRGQIEVGVGPQLATPRAQLPFRDVDETPAVLETQGDTRRRRRKDSGLHGSTQLGGQRLAQYAEHFVGFFEVHSAGLPNRPSMVYTSAIRCPFPT